MSDQGGLPQGSDLPQKASPPVQTAAAPATFWKYLVNDALPSVWHYLPLETNKPANSPELGENWSPLSERTDGNTIFGGNSSNDCWSGSRELRNSSPNVLRADWELHNIDSFFSSLPCHSTMDLEKEAAEREYIAEKGKNVCDEALRIDAKTKLSRLGSKFENISGGKLIIPNARLEKLINECSEKSTNSPTNKIDGDEIISSATDRPEIISEEMASTNSQVPEIGMEFASEKDAHKFYENYAKRCGFKIRRGKVEWSSDGHVKKRILLCSREGFRVKKSPNKSAKYARKETRTGCNARIKIIAQNGKWVISDLCLQHSHGQEDLTQMHKGESSTSHCHSFSKVESLPQFVTEAEILEPAACSDKCSNDVFFGNINGFLEKEREDALSVSSVTTKVQSCSNIPQTPENYKDLASKSGLCQSGLKHLQNPSVLDLENSSGQAKLCMDNKASSSKEVQASSINIDDESMEKFYTNLDSADQNHSGPHVNAHSQGKEQREVEMYEAIGLLRTLLKDKLSAVICSKYLLPLKSALSFLTFFTKEGDLSVTLKSVFLKLARVIPFMIHRYNQTNIIIDQIDNVKAAIESINCKLMENKRMYLELSSTRKAITCEICQIEKLVSFYLQQFNELKAKAEKQMELREEVCKKIQSTYAEGTSLKRKADELDRKVVAMELEKVSAEQTRLELEHEWDKLGKLLEQNLEVQILEMALPLVGPAIEAQKVTPEGSSATVQLPDPHPCHNCTFSLAQLPTKLASASLIFPAPSLLFPPPSPSLLSPLVLQPFPHQPPLFPPPSLSSSDTHSPIILVSESTIYRNSFLPSLLENVLSANFAVLPTSEKVARDVPTETRIAPVLQSKLQMLQPSPPPIIDLQKNIAQP